MIIWTGWGVAVPVITFASLLLLDWATGVYFGDTSYYAENGWPKFVAFTLAALVIWFLGRYLNGGEGRVLIDPATQETVVLKRTHTFFWLRMEYWAPILVGMGVVFAFL
jgi:hypothetical protein